MSGIDLEELRKIKYEVDTSRENFILVQPPTMPEDNPFDPYGQLSHIVSRDWREACPEGKKPCALIIDTFSEAADDIQRFVATSGRGNSGVGEIYGNEFDDAWDDNSIRVTQMNDYSKSQEMAVALLRRMNRSRQFPHVIVLGHKKAIMQTVYKRINGKNKEVTEIKGYDMDVPGRKWLGNMTKFFQQYLWMTDEGVEAMDIRLHLRSDGKHKTKLRCNDPDSVPSELNVPPTYEAMAKVIRDVAAYSNVDMASDHWQGLRTCVYGDGGTGKTMLWTSLPEETFSIGPAVYVPYDPSAGYLTSTWPNLTKKKEDLT